MERWTPAYERLFDPEHELALDEPVCPRWAWLDLVQMARREPGTRVVRMAPLQLDRGELVVSIRYLAERWRWHRNRVQRFLAMLESEEIGKIEARRSTPQGTIYRVTNYDAYALAGTGSGTPGGTRYVAEPRDEPEILGTDSGTPTGHPRDTHGTGTGQETGQVPSRNGATNPESGGQETGQSRGGEGESNNPPIGPPKKSKRPLPDGWTPTDGHRKKATELGVDVDEEADAFRDHHLAHGNKYVDWDRAFHTWLRNTQKFGANSRSPPRANGRRNPYLPERQRPRSQA